MNKKLSIPLCTLVCAAFLIAPAAAVSGNETSRQQMEAQISFFNDVLSEFGATSPDQAVALWAKGDKTRDGVFKYAVACENLKKELIQKWGQPEKSFWIIGGSSPWLSGYSVTHKTVVSSNEVKYTVLYEWATSTGPEPSSTEQLLVIKTDDKWCIKSVVQSAGYHSYR